MIEGTSKNKPGTVTANLYVKRYPTMGSKTLARLMYAENPTTFPTLNAASCAIRTRRGAMGKDHRNQRPVERVVVESPIVDARSFVNKFQIPEGDLADFMPFVLGPDVQRLGIISDLHVPYHDPQALHVALMELRRVKIDTLLINGDLIDFHMLSRFQKDPRARDFKQERECTFLVLGAIRRALPGVRIIYKKGNHEERYDSYMAIKAPEVFKVDEFSFETLFEFPGMEIVGEKRLIVLDRLTILHGHEYTARGITEPVNPARGMFLRAKDSVLVGHWHQPSSHTEPTVRGRPITTWSTGCLCDLHPAYMPLNKWRHGFAIVIRDGGKFRVENRTIIDGALV